MSHHASRHCMSEVSGSLAMHQWLSDSMRRECSHLRPSLGQSCWLMVHLRLQIQVNMSIRAMNQI